MNILFVAEYFYANPDFVRLSEELTKRNHNLSVATSFRAVDEHKRESSVNVFEIEPFVTIYRIPHTLSLPISRITKIAKTQNIDVIHAINDHSTNVASASLVSETIQTPFIYTIQGPGTRTGHPLVDSLVAMYDLTFERWISRIARKVILLSKSLISTAEKLRVEKSKISIVPSGIDTAHFDPEHSEVKTKREQLLNKFDADNKVTVGFAGRLDPHKGLTYLFSAVEALQEKHPNIELLIVGDGAQRADLENMARNLKVKTVFAGWQHDLRPYYSLMDVFVLPSMFEGLSNVILEAMAMGIPVVATDVGGNPDVVSHGENGFIVPPRDVSRLAAAMARLAEDRQMRTKMGELNRVKVSENYQWNTAVEKVEKVYRELA